jgi:hypothetical protein
MECRLSKSKCPTVDALRTVIEGVPDLQLGTLGPAVVTYSAELGFYETNKKRKICSGNLNVTPLKVIFEKEKYHG